MRVPSDKLVELEKQMKQVVKDTQSGKLSASAAADKIVEIREQIQKVLLDLREKKQEK